MVKIARSITRKANADDYLNAAIGIAKNLESRERFTADGLYWHNESNAMVQDVRLDYKFGSSGIALFLAQLSVATGDAQYLDKAKQAADYIIAAIAKADSAQQAIASSGWALWEASAGQASYVAFDLYHIGKIAGEQKYRDAAEAIFAENVATAKPVEQGVIWTGRAEIDQDAGAAIFLAQAAQWFDHPEWLKTAEQAGDAILATEVKINDHQSRYPGYRELLDIEVEGRKQILPGFSHGVSGAAFALLKLYEATQQERFLTAAKRSAAFIESIAEPLGEGLIVPYQTPDNPEHIYYVSYCHGADGTGRLFYELGQVTGTAHYQAFYLKLVQGIAATGAPEKHATGYWNNYSLCCGTAGLLHLFANAWLVTGDAQYQALADRTCEVLLGDANINDDGGYQWFQAWSRKNPGDVHNEIGLHSGDAGIGQIFLEYRNLLEQGDKFQITRQPDDPFPAHA